jgi:hypothetical protein
MKSHRETVDRPKRVSRPLPVSRRDGQFGLAGHRNRSWGRYLDRSRTICRPPAVAGRALPSLAIAFHPYSKLSDRPTKTPVARWAFLPVLAFIGFLCVQRAFSAELQRIGFVSAFDPELKVYGKHLYFFLSGVSMVNAALTTQMAIDHFQLDAIIFSGIAGAVDPKLQPGDVVVPAHWIHQIESDWLNPDSNKPGTYVFPKDFRPKYGRCQRGAAFSLRRWRCYERTGVPGQS